MNMNTRNRNFLMAAILMAASATTLGAQAADQSAFFDQQRQISDGYYPQHTAKDTSNVKTPEADAAQAMWFTHELAKGSVDTYELNKGVATPTQSAAKESPATEAFENQIGEGSVATYTASEHTGSAN
jgi:hypothetical protein